ncbi:hypothetical protein [Armatimonas sp.]|uniref:hypothetical protein n=1 Tax=Armatimonas sp. TaxID=1872638 RepID=UPI00286B060F|nr:hypothetical protein [Armatimonas sp.]
MKESEPAKVIYDGPWHYQGYHGVRSVCYLRLYQPKEPRPAIAIFTEIESNPGTSITNRIEVLTTLAWEFLQKPDAAPVVIEHYPNRGVHNTHTDRWQFPEQFDLLEFDRKPDGSFFKPRWRRVGRVTAEELIGKPFPKM